MKSLKLFLISYFSFEYCIWTNIESGETCKFEWKFASKTVKRQACSNQFTDRMSYIGDYKSHECKVQLTNVTSSDQGQWKCEVEKYVWGLVRGTVAHANLNLTILPELKIYEGKVNDNLF